MKVPPQPFSQSSGAMLTVRSYVLNCASAQLTRDGRAVPLTPKAYSVLLYLVQHAGQLVTKQELLDAGWPDVFVGDAALKVWIREIRKALEDEAQHPQYIETAHRRGYRFIADVNLAAERPTVPGRPVAEAITTRPAFMRIRSDASVCSAFPRPRPTVAGVHTGRDTAIVEQERQGDLLSHWKQDDGR